MNQEKLLGSVILRAIGLASMDLLYCCKRVVVFEHFMYYAPDTTINVVKSFHHCRGI